MAKSLFLIILAGLFGVIMNPGMMSATDVVSVTGIDNSKIVETVILPEPEPEPESAQGAVRENNSAVSIGAPVAGARYEEPVQHTEPALKNYNVTVYSSEIVANNLSYNDIYKTGKLLYAHNSWNLFGNLPSLGWGEYFTVTEGGVTRTYRVENVIVYEKNVERGLLQRNGKGSYMRAVLNATDKDTGMHYNLAMMTCYGTSFGNGDASHRYVIFANEV